MRTLKLLTTILTLLFVAQAQAATGISYHGRLMLPTGEAVKSQTQFRIQIRTPGTENCLMYEETTSRDLSLTDGVFSITIGDGTGSRTDTLGWGLDAIFANRSKFVFTANCAVVTDYTPNAADGRRLQVSFNDGTFAGWEDLPVQNIGFAPISLESVQVGGFKASHLLRVADGAGVPQNVAALTPAYFNELVALAAGTSTVYAKTGAISGNEITNGTIGGSTVIDTTGTIKATSISATTGGFNTVDVWKADNSNKVSLRASGSQSGNYILTLPVDDGNAGQILSTDGSGVLSWTNAASIGAASGDVSGTYPALTVTKIQGQGVSTTTPLTGQAFVFDGSDWKAKNFGVADLKTAAGAAQFASAACTAAQTLTWSSLTDAFTCADITGLKPTSLAAGGVAGQILKIDGSGNLSWDTDATGGGAGTPAGARYDLQFNDNGVVGGDSKLSYVSPGTLFVGERPAGYSTDGNIYMYSGTSARSDLTLRNSTTGNTASDGGSVAQVFNRLVIENNENDEITLSTNSTERMHILGNGNVAIGQATADEKLVVNGRVKATELCIGTDCKAAWPTGGGGSGTVTEVTSANAYLTVATGTTTPALTLNVGTGANTVAAGDDARFTNSRAPSGAASGDLDGTYPSPTIKSISGNAITTGTIAGADIGKVYRWNGTSLAPTFLNFGDLRTAAGAQQLTAACAANEKIQWSVITDAFTCQAIGSLDASVITAGTIDANRLPASSKLWTAVSGDVYRATGNVGIGTNAPTKALELMAPSGANLSDYSLLRFTSKDPPDDTSGAGLVFTDYKADVGFGTDANGNKTALVFNMKAHDADNDITYGSYVFKGPTADVGDLTIEGANIFASNGANGVTASLQAGHANSANGNGGNVLIYSGNKQGTGTYGSILMSVNSGIFRMEGSTGNAGFNTQQPATSLHVVSNQPNSTAQPNRAGLIVDGEGTSYGARIAARAFSPSEGPVYTGYRSLGTKAAPTAVTSGKGLVSLVGYGYDGSNWSANSTSPGITLETSEAWSGTAKGSRIVFGTTANTTTAATERMRIDHNGSVGIGTGSAALTSLLEVNGTLSAGASTFATVAAGTGTFGTVFSTGISINGTSDFAPVMSIRNQSATGFSGTYMTDTTGNPRGLIGYGNASSIFPGAIVLGSTDTSTPLVFGVNGIETARILATNGYFGIGTSNPLTPLHVDINAAVAVATFENSTGNCSITPTTSSLSCSSDIRLKRNIENILGLTALNKIIQLQAKTYEWKGGDNTRHIGFIAQEAEKIVPELVTEDAKGYKQISYSGFVPLLSEAIKEVHQESKRDIASVSEENEELKKQVEALKKKNDSLEQKNKSFEDRLSKLEKLLAK